jgi:hypothetical protein
MRPRFSPLPEVVLLLLASALSGCSSDHLLQPIVPVTKSITVDASAAYAYLALDTTAQVVTVSSPSTSTAWDMAFFATGVTLNGGASGPGGVSGYCLCHNESSTNAQVEAMTAANQAGGFDSVTTADIPAVATFTADALDPVINGWFSGSGAGATPVITRSFILRKAPGGSVILAKLRVTQISGASAAAPGSVTFEYAIQPSSGAAFGSVQTKTVAVAAGTPLYFDLTAGAASTVASWDIEFDGWAVRVNGGVSGTGGVSAVPDNATAFASIDAAYAASAPPQAYRSDTFSGVFAQHPWYRYNITGSDNQIWPTYNVYLVRRGTAVYRVQLTGYYSAAGAPRNITIRYAKLSD